MKKLIYLMTAVMILGSCSASSDDFKITLDLEETEGKWLTLTTRVDREYITVDSALVAAGVETVLSGSLKKVQTMHLGIKDERSSFNLLMENAEYKITGTMENPEIVTSAPAQTDLNNYNALVGEFDKKLGAIVEGYYAAMGEGDEEKAKTIIAQYEEINIEKQEVDSSYLAENPASFASVLILRNSFYNYDTEGLEKALTTLDPKVQVLEEWTYMHDIMEKQKAVDIGKAYKDFALPTPEGDLLKISDVHQGQVLLIDFWASWCGPCRRANPELVKLYAEYHEKGFEIIGVSLDSDRQGWLKAIEDDKLTWPHISDVKGWNCEGAKLYGVPAIPHTVLVDREGIIRHKKLHGEELTEAILSLL